MSLDTVVLLHSFLLQGTILTDIIVRLNTTEETVDTWETGVTVKLLGIEE